MALNAGNTPKNVTNMMIGLLLIVLIWNVFHTFKLYEIEYFEIERDEMDDKKIKILISGYGHSGTTYLQQFIGEVLFDKNETFYLFEAMHTRKLKYFAKYYNVSTTKYFLNDDNVRSRILSDFYHCKFNPNMEYTKLVHTKQIMEFNSNLDNNLTSTSLTEKCVSSKYLVFKEIDYHRYQYNYDYLLEDIPNLIIIALIRNPLKHILSFRRMKISRRGKMDKYDKLKYCTDLICHQQLKDIKYGLQNWRKYNYNLLKMEAFFEHIGNQSVNEEIIQYFSNIIWNKTVDRNYLHRVYKKYVMMQHNIWRIGREKQLKPHQQPKPKDIQYIENNCADFLRFTKYQTSTSNSTLFKHKSKIKGET